MYFIDFPFTYFSRNLNIKMVVFLPTRTINFLSQICYINPLGSGRNSPLGPGRNIINNILLREALFTSGSAKLEDVRSFVRPFVRIIIDFCEWHQEGAETLLYLGSLNYRF